MSRYLPLFSFFLTSLLGSAESSHWEGKMSEYMETEPTSSYLPEVYSNESIEPESVSIPYYLNVYVNDSITVTPWLSPNNAQTTYTWYSKDPSIAEVKDGVVYGIGEGETDIYCVTANDKTSNNCHVTVFDITIIDLFISPSDVIMNLHETCQLSYKVNPPYVHAKVTWESDNIECAEVSQDGLVTPKAAGTARIIVKTVVGEKTDTCTVKVLPDPEKIEVPEKMSLAYETSGNIPVSVTPPDAYAEFSWNSDDPSIVSVDGEGNIYACGVGSANISVETHNGKKSICTVEVPLPFTGISVLPNDVTINLYETCQLSYQTIPTNLQTPVTWESDNIECAEVSQTGLVTPKAAGTARIIVNTVVGEKTDTCNVKVLPDPEKIEVPEKMSLIYETKGKIPVSVTPPDAYAEFSWDSDNPSVVSVDGEGNIYACGVGSANISVETHNGKKSICTVEVPLPFTGISVLPADVTMNLYETYQLSYQTIPTNVQTPVTWESDNIECAEVSQTGLVTPKAAGTARISVKTVLGGKTATCTVKVLPDPEKIEISEKLSLVKGESTQLPVTVTPSDAYAEFLWDSDNPSVVSVDGEGNIYAYGVGSATITVETHNGKKAVCTVEVLEPEPDYWLVVWLKDGRKVVEHLVDKPEVRYNDGSFILVSEDFTAEYDVNDVRKFTLSDNPEEELDCLTETQIPTVKLSQFSMESVTITDGTPGAKTLIYSISGSLLGSYVADQMGTTYIPLGSMPIGVLIIKSETITYKVLKK